jgi:hypothetical protein
MKDIFVEKFCNNTGKITKFYIFAKTLIEFRDLETQFIKFEGSEYFKRIG